MKKLDISLNSIEPLIRQISELTKIQRIIACCVSVVLIIGGFVYFLYMPKYEDINKLNQNIAQQQEKLQKTKKSAAQYADYQKKLDTLNKQIKIVNQLKEYRKKPPLLLAKMTEMVVPGRMQLTRLVSDDANLTLVGDALDNETIAVFMLRLERSDLFSDVVLESSKQVNKYNVDMKQFNIKCKKAVAPINAAAPNPAG